jgi:hypothetical protein
LGIIPTLGTDAVLHAIHVFPPWGQSMVGFDGPLLLATVYRTVYGVLGSYIIARVPIVAVLAGVSLSQKGQAKKLRAQPPLGLLRPFN